MKTIIVGVSGSIAAYKACDLVRTLKKMNYNVEIIMTENATKFISPLTLGALVSKPVLIYDFDDEGYQIKHIKLAKQADLFVVVPATANIIGKIANGICDDVLTSTFIAATCPKLIAPAMNVNMYDNLATQRNIERCKTYGIKFVEPGYGLLACGDLGRGKLADLDDIITMIEYCLSAKPLKNKRVLVTAGPTQEAIDPVRFITNHSSGKMGYAIAKQAFLLGAKVTLISGPTNLKAAYGINKIDIISAHDMFEKVKENYQKQDYIIKAAAVGDYRAKEVAENKIKKKEESLVIEMIKNDDILAFLGANKTHQIVCGFAMETEELIKHAKEKFIKKNCDLLVANNLTDQGAGFKKDTNKVTLISADQIEELELMSKDDVAKTILTKLIKIQEDKNASSN
ncbi:bifunctional phosphopantothenoylcysteine decarboxylase/phosphopantothenate--cysteine ligase CoaBC [uncultured Thomasclavelia sp.]|uniref:bifunctional phosphopantothenoylcysteine decarboxylase/phosphopantothenate--cysteine ligase CoaBC n=1 Tax=uncultured Thomasclavelia sp. TaxID=3025759 RepID=UPI0025F8A93E|nr:bifunctional phosphopantothenoylcysteine decarboxylase/phosphopantothenate--cysteine ligase CoaBC [uncultured Thomasclavelia sp.]